MTDLQTGTPVFTPRRRAALPPIAVVGVAVAWAVSALPLGPPGAALALGCYALIAVLVVDGLGRGHPHRRFGPGNAITLVRAGGTAVFAGLAAQPELVAGAGWIAPAGVATLLALDGADGWAARRWGHASAFGARFDMEIDAALILALAVLALGLGRAGPWVLGLGLMRYAFVLAGLVWPVLARPLPVSRRRSGVCVLQVVVLGLLLTPPLVPPASGALAAIAFAALAGSFATDIAWLTRRQR